jgi:hypothetical protein
MIFSVYDSVQEHSWDRVKFGPKHSWDRVEFGPKPSRHYQAVPPPLSRYTGASHSNLSLGGGAPAYRTAAVEVLGARAPPDTVPAAIEDRPSRLLIVSLLSIVSAAESMPNGIPFPSRSRRKKPCFVSCPVARARAPPCCRPWHLSDLCFAHFIESKKLPSRPPLDLCSRLEPIHTPSMFSSLP